MTTLSEQLQETILTLSPGKFNAKGITDIDKLLRIADMVLNSSDTPVLVKALRRHQEFSEKYTSIWPSCRNMFSYRVTAILPHKAVLVNVPAILVNSRRNGESNFLMWDDEDSLVFPMLKHVYYYGNPEIRGEAVLMLMHANAGFHSDKVLIVPDNKGTDLSKVPQYIQIAVRFLRDMWGTLAGRETKLTFQKIRKAIATNETHRPYGFPGESISKIMKVKNNFYGEPKSKITNETTNKVGVPADVGAFVRARKGLLNRNLMFFEERGLPLGILVSKTKEATKLHISIHNILSLPFIHEVFSNFRIENRGTYMMGNKLAKEVIPCLSSVINRGYLLNSVLRKCHSKENTYQFEPYRKALMLPEYTGTLGKLLRNSKNTPLEKQIIPIMRMQRSMMNYLSLKYIF